MVFLNNIYHPITATPFEESASYMEIAPCNALRPYIRCFWGTPYPVRISDILKRKKSLVIPDTCMDIIFYINYTKNKYNGIFCTIDENSYQATDFTCDALCSTFAIRFYAWSAILFSEGSFNGCKNQSFDASCFFHTLQKEIEPLLFDVTKISDKIRMVEKILLKRLNLNRQNDNLMSAVYQIVLSNGNIRMSELVDYVSVSARQLERIFSENMGVSPKTLASLIRYQLLWQEIVYNRSFHLLDAVDKYGYYDQAHLLHDFKKRHLMTPAQAVEYAYGR